jgi:2-iminobutanoate/2-iminopropanoate deaminase
MPKEIVEVPGLSEGLRANKVPLSPAVKANGFVFVSGQPPFDVKTGELIKGDLETQTRASLEAVKYVLECAGSSMEKVVKVTVFSVNSAHFARFNEVYKTYFPKDPPARTFVTVGSWPLDFDIEIECIALAD